MAARLDILIEFMEPLKDEVITKLPWLFDELDFRIVDERYEPKFFGDSYVTLVSRAFNLRFVRDRGQIFLEVASHSDSGIWWPLEHVCELISGLGIKASFELLSSAALLRSNVSGLADFLGPKYRQTKRELLRREEARKQELLRLSRQQAPSGNN